MLGITPKPEAKAYAFQALWQACLPILRANFCVQSDYHFPIEQLLIIKHG
jgi:surfactin synthase thioesterase subunit